MSGVPVSGSASPHLPAHFGANRASVPFGVSPSGTMSVLTISTRARAPKPVQRRSGSRNSSGMSFALGESYASSRPSSARRIVWAISLFQKTSVRGRDLDSSMIART